MAAHLNSLYAIQRPVNGALEYKKLPVHGILTNQVWFFSSGISWFGPSDTDMEFVDIQMMAVDDKTRGQEATDEEP